MPALRLRATYFEVDEKNMFISLFTSNKMRVVQFTSE